jgi:phage gpG-like protein
MAYWNDPRIPIIDPEALIAEWVAAMEDAAGQARTLAITKYIGKKRPEYAPLAASTIKAKGHDRPLIDQSRLRNSITAKVLVVRFGGQVKVIGIIGTNVEYARRQELGFPGDAASPRTPARPFLEPAVEEARRRFEQRIGNAPAKCVKYV